VIREIGDISKNLQIWLYLRNVLLFFVVTPAAMVVTAAALRLLGQHIPLSLRDFLIDEAKQAYFISAVAGLPLSVIHTYLLRHAHADSGRPTLWRSTLYAGLLGLLSTVSLLRFFALGYDAIFYLVPATLCYGIVAAWLGVGALQDLPQDYGQVARKLSAWRYLFNAVLFVIIASVVITLGLWIGLKAGILEGIWIATPSFLFILAICLSMVHTFLLQDVSGVSSKVIRRRSLGLVTGLAILATAPYVVVVSLEFMLIFVAALIYGLMVGQITSKTVEK